MGDGWNDWAYKAYSSGKPGEEFKYVSYGTTTGDSGIYGGSNTTITTTTTGDYTVWTDGSPYYTNPEGVTEYTLEEGVIKYKDPETHEWRKIEDLELGSDPFPIEKKEAKPKQARKAKIKLNKKLGVDMEEVAEELF